MSLAGMSPFWVRFPELAPQETRVLFLPTPQGGLPAGRFGLLELYCDDPACDCRRVILQVRSETEPHTILATINYGWESVAFYTKWMHGDRQAGREIAQASLDPINPQSPLAPDFLRLFQTVVLKDRATSSGSPATTPCSNKPRLRPPSRAVDRAIVSAPDRRLDLSTPASAPICSRLAQSSPMCSHSGRRSSSCNAMDLVCADPASLKAAASQRLASARRPSWHS